MPKWLSWIGVIGAILKAGESLISYFNNKKLMDAGAAEENSKAQQQALSEVEKGNDASTEVMGHPNGEYADSVRDKYTRDN